MESPSALFYGKLLGLFGTSFIKIDEINPADPSATSNEDQEENKEGHCSSSKPGAKFWGRETFWGDVSSEEWTERY